MSTSSVQKTKATWTPALHEIFVDLCLEQTLKGNKPGTHFTKEGWRNIVDRFQKRTGSRYDKKQIKNHWDITQKQWKTWYRLIGDNSMRWDPETYTFGASDEDWTNYLEANPEAAQYQHQKLQHADKLKVIFDSTVDSEYMQTPPRCKRQSDSSMTFQLLAKEPVTAELCRKKELYSPVRLYSPHGRRIASELSTSASSLSRDKATWTPACHEIFVDRCLEETLKGNRPGTHFTKEAWRIIVESFNEKAGVSYNRIQIKNHWDATKEQWRIWCKLVNTSSMKWDPVNSKFGASDEDWVNFIQANPEAAQFWSKEMHHADKLEIIFDETMNAGETDPPVQCRRLNDSSTMSILHVGKQGTAKPARKTEHHNDTLESMTAVTIQKSPAILQPTHEKLRYSIGECIESLDGMEEVEPGNELYLFALDVFLKKEYREIFLQLKKSGIRIAWLQRLQYVGPSLQ
ncbi:hypothetical protein CRYUN_Cryun05aG0153000 [Craigia yunnanensis]